MTYHTFCYHPVTTKRENVCLVVGLWLLLVNEEKPKLQITPFKFGQTSIQFSKFWLFQLSPLHLVLFQFSDSVKIPLSFDFFFSFNSTIQKINKNIFLE